MRNNKKQPYSDSRSDAALAERVVRIAEAARVQAIVCVTESGAFARELKRFSGHYRLVAATTNPQTHAQLVADGYLALHLPLYAVDKYSQIRHVLSVVIKSNSVAVGELVVCAVGNDVYPDEANLIVVTEAETDLEEVLITDLVKLTDGIRPKALECAMRVAGRVGRITRRGKAIGAIFVLGDSLKVLEGSKQLIPNPFLGHDKDVRMITNPGIHDALIEMCKLDGAFVIRGDGYIQTAGLFLSTAGMAMEVPVGLGARHTAAAAVTARTAATAIVVSATDGNVRVFSGGRMVLIMDPEIEHGPIHISD